MSERNDKPADSQHEDTHMSDSPLPGPADKAEEEIFEPIMEEAEFRNDHSPPPQPAPSAASSNKKLDEKLEQRKKSKQEKKEACSYIDTCTKYPDRRWYFHSHCHHYLEVGFRDCDVKQLFTHGMLIKLL